MNLKQKHWDNYFSESILNSLCASRWKKNTHNNDKNKIYIVRLKRFVNKKNQISYIYIVILNIPVFFFILLLAFIRDKNYEDYVFNFLLNNNILLIDHNVFSDTTSEFYTTSYYHIINNDEAINKIKDLLKSREILRCIDALNWFNVHVDLKRMVQLICLDANYDFIGAYTTLIINDCGYTKKEINYLY